MKTVIVADANIPFVEPMYSGMTDVRLLEGHSITAKDLRDADLLLVRSVTKVGKELLEGSRIKFVGTATSGFDHVDTEYLASRRIKFVYAAGSNSNSVAEYIVAAVLILKKRFGVDLHKMTIGVVGVGNVGSKVVRKAKALGMSVLQNDPPLKRQTGNNEFLSIEELMNADIVTLHVPLTYQGMDATCHLFEEKRIAAMKPGSILINTSRGPVVKTEALRNALTSAHLRTAVLDVWENEPEIDEEVMSMAAIGTPHIAGYSSEGKTNGAVMIYEAVCEYLQIDQTWDVEGKLPPSNSPRICITNQNRDHLEVLSEIVRQCYDIEGDDVKLRKGLELNREARKYYFNKLRSEYPVRREFAATSIEIQQSHRKFGESLTELGFSVIMS